MFTYCLFKKDDNGTIDIDRCKGFIVCPICNRLEEFCTIFKYSDYVSDINMIWCYSCGALWAVPQDTTLMQVLGKNMDLIPNMLLGTIQSAQSNHKFIRCKRIFRKRYCLYAML